VLMQHQKDMTGEHMKMNCIDNILAKAKSKKYQEVINEYSSLSESDQLNEDVLIAYGDSLYELEYDIDALKVYLKLAVKYPHGRAVNFSLFGAALALRNLDLQEQAYTLLKLIDKKHSGLTEKLANIKEILEQKNIAKLILENFLNDKGVKYLDS